MNLGTTVDSALGEETVVLYALAVCLLHCVSQGVNQMLGIWFHAFFTNLVSRASVVCLCTDHRVTSLRLPDLQTCK